MDRVHCGLRAGFRRSKIVEVRICFVQPGDFVFVSNFGRTAVPGASVMIENRIGAPRENAQPENDID